MSAVDRKAGQKERQINRFRTSTPKPCLSGLHLLKVFRSFPQSISSKSLTNKKYLGDFCKIEAPKIQKHEYRLKPGREQREQLRLDHPSSGRRSF
jgi:hypothetical protein